MLVKSNATILESAARTATPTIANLDLSNNDLTDVHITIDVTAVTSTPSVQPALQGQDPLSGKWYDLIASITAITGVGTTTIQFGESTAIVANNSNQGFIPETIRLVMTHADADSITYSIGVNFRLHK